MLNKIERQFELVFPYKSTFRVKILVNLKIHTEASKKNGIKWEMYLPKHSTRGKMWYKVNSRMWITAQFSFSLTGCCTKAKEPNLLCNLQKLNRGLVDKMNLFIPFPRALAWSEMETVLSRNWTPHKVG